MCVHAVSLALWPPGDGIEEDVAAAELGWPYIRVLLAPAEHYPAQHVAALRPEAATGGPGLPFTQLTLAHVAASAGLQATPAEQGQDSTAAAEELAADGSRAAGQQDGAAPAEQAAAVGGAE